MEKKKDILCNMCRKIDVFKNQSSHLVGYIARMGEMRNTYKIIVGKQLGRLGVDGK
jgi:hypothetical protein